MPLKINITVLIKISFWCHIAAWCMKTSQNYSASNWFSVYVLCNHIALWCITLTEKTFLFPPLCQTSRWYTTFTPDSINAHTDTLRSWIFLTNTPALLSAAILACLSNISTYTFRCMALCLSHIIWTQHDYKADSNKEWYFHVSVNPLFHP